MTIYKLDSFPNFEPVHCSTSGSNCCFLTRIQVFHEAGKVVWYSHLFKNFPPFVVIHTVKGFSVVNEAEVDVFLEFLCLLYDPTGVGNMTSGFSVFSKFNLHPWKFSVHVLLKPSLKAFEHNLTSICNEYNCMVVWTFFGTVFLWDWNVNWPFLVLWPLPSFPNLLIYWVQYFNISIFLDKKKKKISWNSITSISFVCSNTT